MKTQTRQRKEALLQLFQAGVDAVGGLQATRRALADEHLSGPLYLVAIGKAANAMAQGALEILGDSLVSGLVITKHDHLSDGVREDTRLECIESGHPVPDEQSLHAGLRLYDFVAKIPEEHQLIFLVSGGASALVENLDNNLTLTDLKTATDKLLASGAPIGEMNRQRRQMSLIKGGKLARVLKCKVLQLLISDVPGDVLGDIGSGLLVPDAATGMHEHLPVWQRVTTRIIASSLIAQTAVAESAKAQGLDVQQASGDLNGDIDVVAERVTQTLVDAKRGVYIWGGEPTVVLPDKPGRGGRNQHLALSLATMAAEHGRLSILVCGTDGTDGPTGDAGGCVDELSTALADKQAIDIAQFLQAADAGTALAALDLLVTTGPTGTNVMDLCIAFAD
ncbi:MAG: glycerate kinase [Granulosicoccus sp.]